MENLIDLHTHSYISDGKDSPSIIESSLFPYLNVVLEQITNRYYYP